MNQASLLGRVVEALAMTRGGAGGREARNFSLPAVAGSSHCP